MRHTYAININCFVYLFIFFSWKELIPQILKMVSEIKTLSTEEIEMSGADYKEMIITDMCRSKVQSKIAIPLALMYR